MMVIFLVGLVSMILMRTLRKDYARYSKEDDGEDMVIMHYAKQNDLTSKWADCEFKRPLFQNI